MDYITRQKLVNYCLADKMQLMALCDWYTSRESDGGLLGFKAHPDGDAKILVVAHIDYLQSGNVHVCNRKQIISSALDDRAGVYIAFHLLPKYNIKADILLTDFEERGASTISGFGQAMLNKYNWVLQLDRRGEDAVTYGYTEMRPYLEEFWKVNRGSFSDIALLDGICPVSAFNMGVGYEREHTELCNLSWKVLRRQMARLVEFYNKYRDHKFERKHSPVEYYYHTEAEYRKRNSWKDKWRNPATKKTTPTTVIATVKPKIVTATPKETIIIGAVKDEEPAERLCAWCGKGNCTLFKHPIYTWWVCTECCDLLTDEAKERKHERESVTRIPVQGAEGKCDICQEMQDNLRYLEEIGWWACELCVGMPADEQVDEVVKIIKDPHGVDDGGKLH